MRDDHSQAHNLFSRLIACSPRIGEANQARTALEDYFTEALAWCLRSPAFRKEFFDLIKEVAPVDGNKLPSGDGAGIEVHTQLSFTPAGDGEADETEGPAGRRRRFDLVIQSSTEEQSFVIVIENKVSWRFTNDQLIAYQDELTKGKLFKGFSAKLLILPSPSGRIPDSIGTPPVTPLRWSDVQRKLIEFSGGVHGRLHEQMNLPVIQFVSAQFADFLKEKGLASMKIASADGAQLSGWIAGFEAQESMARILASVRENRKVLGKEPVFDANDDGSRWLGLYSKDGGDHFYVGFRLRDAKGNSEMHLWVQFSPPKEKALKDKLIRHLQAKSLDVEDGDEFNFSKRVTGAELDGNRTACAIGLSILSPQLLKPLMQPVVAKAPDSAT
jgi:hypothetical protein